jgi:hypothetical protein
MLLAADFGDAPAPYPTLLAANGASHEAIGPTLGALRDSEADGAPSAAADADGADDDGVTFGTIRVGQLGATVTVNVQNAPTGAKLDAWIDFDGDGNWGGALEQIASSIAVGEGANVIAFDLPSNAVSGAAFARFRLSTAGELNTRSAALDGEVEDYSVTIDSPVLSSGIFGGQNIVTTAAIDANDVHAADIDGDGDMDILAAHENQDNSTHNVTWYENNGSEVFVPHHIKGFGFFQVNDIARSASAADIDGDGDLDVLTTLNSGFIGWYENDSTPAVGGWAVHGISTQSQAFGTQAGDVDGDGDLDVMSVFSFNNGSQVSWWENDGTPGDGTWTQHAIEIVGAAGANSIHSTDLDRDGDLDVVVAALDADRIIWYINNGIGGFSRRVIATAIGGGTGVFTADLDRDGDVDIISSSPGSDKIAWYENDGTPTAGAWVAHTISTSADYAQSVFAADLDGDGDMDIASASAFDDKIAWYENDGTPAIGEWTTRTISTAANYAQSVFAADVDGDGDLDVLSASDHDNKIAWYENIGSLLGDYDRDLDVDPDDRDTWQTHFGDTSGPGLDADGNGDSVVDAADYVLWRKIYGNGGGGGGSTGVELTQAASANANEPGIAAVETSPSFVAIVVSDTPTVASAPSEQPTNVAPSVATTYIRAINSTAPARRVAVDQAIQRWTAPRIDLLLACRFARNAADAYASIENPSKSDSPDDISFDAAFGDLESLSARSKLLSRQHGVKRVN